MSSRSALAVAALSLAVSFPALGADLDSLQRTKTAILPSGGFYSLYQGRCADERSAWIARLDGGVRWCARAEGNLNCFPRPQQALQSACAQQTVAVTERETAAPIEF
ncbi:MAG: hypothetical protein Hals2KO_38530 [Halioglobus sp.]